MRIKSYYIQNIADMFHCYQVRVKYSHQEFKEGVKADEISNDKWVSLERLDNIEDKVRDIFLILWNSYFLICPGEQDSWGQKGAQVVGVGVEPKARPGPYPIS